MKSTQVTILAAFSLLLAGCATKRVLIGGDRVMHYPVGVAVPGVSSAENTGGIYQLTDSELDAIVNP